VKEKRACSIGLREVWNVIRAQVRLVLNQKTHIERGFIMIEYIVFFSLIAMALFCYVIHELRVGLK
jgi:hypothetical protein